MAWEGKGADVSTGGDLGIKRKERLRKPAGFEPAGPVTHEGDRRQAGGRLRSGPTWAWWL